MAQENAQVAYARVTTDGYIHGETIRDECATAPLNGQMEALLVQLWETQGVLEALESSLPVQALRPDRPERIEGLTALVAACHTELGTVRMMVDGIAQRIGRL